MRTILEPEAMQCYEAAGRIIQKVRCDIRPLISKNTKLYDIAERIEGGIIGEGGRPAFPCTIAINEIASHYTPLNDDEQQLNKGDLVKLDFGASVDGYIADAAFTIEVETNAHAGLIKAAEKALAAGIAQARPGACVSDIGRAIEQAALNEGFNVLKDLLGHSLSRYRIHGGLTIPPYDNGSDMRIREGDVLAIEPFLTAGSGAVARAKEGNIYQLIRNGEIYARLPAEKKLLEYITDQYGVSPFASRWLPDMEGLEGLIRAACVKSYPVLVESDGEAVAQAESTVIVESGGCRTIT